MFRFLAAICVMAAAAAYLSKPTEQDIEAQIGSVLQQAIESGNIRDVTDPGAMLLLAACKSDASACAQLARQAIDITYSDKTLFVQVNATGFGREMTCYGAFTRLLCPDAG